MKNAIDILRRLRREGWPDQAEGAPPPVDDAQLRLFVSHTSPKDEAELVALWVATSPEWRRRYAEIVLED